MSTRTRRTASEKSEEKEARRAPAAREEEPAPLPGQDLASFGELGRIPALLGDAGYSAPPNLPRQAPAILGLQRALGNVRVQRLVEAGARERPASEPRKLPDETAQRIEAARAGGQPLAPAIKEEMEAALGRDFGAVRVHTGPEAHALAEGVGARAFTTGRDIFFRNGAYDPGSPAGRETLGHELAHVVQQAGSNGAVTPGLSLPSDTAEVEASAVGSEVASTRGERPLSAAVSEVAALQRQGDGQPPTTAVSTPGAAAPAPAEPAAGSRAAVALAMWRSAVVGPQTRAGELLGSPNRGNIATARELLGSAREAANALANTFPGDSFPRARVMQYSNALYGVIADLGPHAGTVVPVDEIRAALGGTAASQAAVEAALQQEEKPVVPASGGV
ncbi:MAG: DUF4157 domain-containing protein [Chloroflexi bacterium]|nr:DUF4157 domain-containing protein [Chloroflexota bacterium]